MMKNRDKGFGDKDPSWGESSEGGDIAGNTLTGGVSGELWNLREQHNRGGGKKISREFSLNSN